MIADRTTPTASEKPSPAAAQLELVAAAMASVKPSQLVKVEARVTELRAERAVLSKELAAAVDAAYERQQRGGAMPANVVALERKIAGLDEDIRSARSDMRRRREAFAVDFRRVAGEFHSQAAEKIRSALPDLIAAFEVLDAVDNVAMRAGIEFRSRAAEVRAALAYLNGV